ncbi:uncharacterized protein GGS22DRAFT_170370 [Annulohypoxylon maeteangense]|uniref:uncharacterized protein n=1 Tax=Annulohypoxylon maeteangense TaxID=1927788 RepID=UPI002008D1D7|nr:uncharacterized protein GGS22DRAFT_170370 [Annulohypoxylon maeteangense]KAI0882171.1 hypothetical protein GGS22DRAFT_170370 [Annulohypoxylon maeteangense]
MKLVRRAARVLLQLSVWICDKVSEPYPANVAHFEIASMTSTMVNSGSKITARLDLWHGNSMGIMIYGNNRRLSTEGIVKATGFLT